MNRAHRLPRTACPLLRWGALAALLAGAHAATPANRRPQWLGGRNCLIKKLITSHQNEEKFGRWQQKYRLGQS